MKKVRNLTHRFLLGLIALTVFALPLALPPGVGAQSGKVFFDVFTSASRGTTTSSTLNLQNVRATGLVGLLDVTANTGTNPTLDLVVQDSVNSTGPWFTLMTFTQVTGSTSNQTIVAARSPTRYVRVVGTVGGTATPKFTYTFQLMAFDAGGLAATTSTNGAVTSTALTITTANGASATYGSNSELLTLSTGGATTDTTANLLPAGAIIDSVEAVVTTAITTATAFGLGDPTTATRFTAAAAAAAAAGTRIVGIDMNNGNITTTAAGPTQAAAAKVRVTANGTPGAGAVRITVFYRQFTAPTS